MPGHARYVALAATLLACSPTARAQDVAAPPVDASRDDEARSLFQAGSAALDDGRFADALGYFERSYALSRRAALLYNIGIVAATLGRRDRAIEAFRQFLREDPSTDRRQEVDGRVRSLEEQQRRRRRLPEAPPAADDDGPGAGPWIVIAGSGAALAGGVVLFGVGLGANSTVESSTDWPSVSSDYDRGKLFTTLGAILGAVGIAGAAAGVVWLVAGGSGGDGQATVEVSAGLGGLSVGGTF